MNGRLVGKLIVAAIVVSMTAAASFAWTATQGRVIPSGTVEYHKNGELIATFTEQAPINDTALMTCNKPCVVKLTSMSFKVKANTTFSIRDNNEAVDLYVKKGLVAFAVNNITQKVLFFTPDGRYVSSEGFIAPTSTDNAVEGYMSVSDTLAQIGVNRGGLILVTGEGVQTIDEGYSYNVDLNNLPATAVGGDVNGGSGSSPFPLQDILIGGGIVGAGAGVSWFLYDNDDTPRRGSQHK